MRSRRDRDPPGLGASRTRRQQLDALLRRETVSFETLRALLRVSVRQLEEDLRHVARSARGSGARFEVEPARCAACGFVFGEREPRRLHTPGRCPRCRSERIEDPSFRIVSRSPAPGGRHGG